MFNMGCDIAMLELVVSKSFKTHSVSWMYKIERHLTDSLAKEVCPLVPLVLLISFRLESFEVNIENVYQETSEQRFRGIEHKTRVSERSVAIY